MLTQSKTMKAPSPEIPWPVREEIANITLHSFGLFLSLIGFGLMVAFAALTGSAVAIISCSIYAVSLALVYVASIMFHTTLAVDYPFKKAFETIDHCAIYLLIAGTYTPFLMVHIQGTLGWSVLALIWTLAISGILYKVFFFYNSDLLSTLAYIVMGWISLSFMHPLYLAVGWQGVGLLLLGGVLYTVGALFYLFDHKFHFAHAIWHSFVLAASICHYFTVMFFVLRPLWQSAA